MSGGKLLVFPGLKGETRTQVLRDLCERQGMPFIDLDKPITMAENQKVLARALGIPEELLDMPMNDDDPHDIGEVAEQLADAFNNGDLAALKREFERRSPLYAAALSLAVLTRIRPHERTDFHAMMQRMARS